MLSLRVVIITGLSGSGKTTALRALEDIGFFCVDNLPIILLPEFLSIQKKTSNEVSKIALVMDLRERYFLEKHIEIISQLKKKKYNIEILFLEATNESLLHRFSETRRTHPLSNKRNVLDSIILERAKLHDMRELADDIIDTTFYNVHQLKKIIQERYLSLLEHKKLIINLTSFGYRFGLPPDADIVLDVRFLPNPYFIEELKEQTGNDKNVEEYVVSWDDTRRFQLELYKFMAFLIPLYEKEGKSYLNISVGCTGGKHRSVVIINQLAQHFRGRDYTSNVVHRDIERN